METGVDIDLNHSLQISPREKDIIELLASGKTSTEMASELHLSKHTINTHKKNLMRKFKANNCVQLAVEAFKRGLIQ